jgi:RHS repeat-associated protein
MVAAPLISLNLTGTAWATPAHDQAGNMTSLPTPSSLATGLGCVWDAWNRLVEVKDGGSVMATHEYDGLNRRTIEMPDYGATTYYMHKYWNSSWQMLEQRQNTNDGPPESSGVARQCVWSARYIDALVWESLWGARRYFLGDGNFNVTSVINTSGEALEHYQYDPYGKLTVLNGGTPDGDGAEWTADPNDFSDISNHYLYTGRWEDCRTRLYYYRNRYYSAELGRFLSRDPIGDDAESANLYAYVESKPLGATDPSGLKPPKQWWEDDWYDSLNPLAYSAMLGDWWGAFLTRDVDAYGVRLYALHQRRIILESTLPGGPDARELRKYQPVGKVTLEVLRDAADLCEKEIETVVFATDIILLADCGHGAVRCVGTKLAGRLTLRGTPKAQIVGDRILEFLGKDSRMIVNKAGDPIFISKDGLRRVRFDINRPYSHTGAHVHIEVKVAKRWMGSGPLYPKDVPPY